MNCRKTAGSCISPSVASMPSTPIPSFIFFSLTKDFHNSSLRSFCYQRHNREFKFEITGEENLKVYLDPKTLSGTPVERFFCGTCGKSVSSLVGNRARVLKMDSPIKSVTPLYQGKSVLKLGIFDKIPEPEWESFVLNRQKWEKPLEGTTQYKTKSFSKRLE